MDILIKISLVLVLMITAYQDIKSRMIHAALPILVVFAGAYFYMKSSISIYEALYSVAFIAVCMLAITIQFSIKNKKLANPFDVAFGLGDVLFLIALIPFFNFKNYVLFFVGSLLFSLILFAISKLFIKNELIPLAGYMAIALLLVVLYQWNYEPNLTYQNLF